MYRTPQGLCLYLSVQFAVIGDFTHILQGKSTGTSEITISGTPFTNME